MKSIIYHLVKTRQRFVRSSLEKNLFDVAIITGLPHPELQAVLKLGSRPWEQLVIENDFLKFFKNTFTSGSESRTVVAAAADQMGMTAASHLATKMI